MPQPAALPIPPEDLATLRGWSAATQAPAVQVQRARILLLAAEGVANSEIAERLGVCRPTVIAWRKRYCQEGSAGGWPTGIAVAAPRPCAGPDARRSWPRR
jgi:hypothetical protein